MFNKDLILKAINNKGWSKYRLCKEANLAQSTLSDILTGKNLNPRMDTIQKIATALNVSVDTFFDNNIEVNFINTNELKNDDLVLTSKNEKDIQKSLSATLDMLQNPQEDLMFDGEPLDDLTRELLAQSLENSIRLAKKIAKEKYTPNKYKK
ncbi:helix-turn-helix transcriptional regulator [Clostridium botulinum]|uniref:helix-turn-helix domain-containing protein n=1 Tax=Clostridium botulinum TaxID=1491 RepID=UPI0013F06E82|nr:helix-turn-helix transcriptional regulator [Clostridium botulinum]MBN1042413.1 XRE family transcriptional regulator [Clostridium botulinum]NFL35591.1 helix-turn-helix transcriptional regulator [Clostridium botulinum]NFM02485.1 helix-turn-helix transcriptional regulator [Clostridium botulinum]NFO48033.1 helix-turn-helix transcriptional regulator [Clostridium botulinum]NFO56344.1 helix-turn-helix transcriptional regulator [Clostridium botulinum]